jgi:hypothetical protein
MTTLLDIALYWVKAGVSVIPIKFRDKRPDARLLPKNSAGDAEWQEFQTRLPSQDELKRWFPTNLHNLAIVTGWRNLVVVDFDDLGTYLKWSTWATRQGGMTRRIIEMTYMVRTARGVHAYFRTAQPEQNRKLEGIDIKARGGYVLGEGSTHPTGVMYERHQQGSPACIEALSDILPAQFLIQKTQAAQPVSQVTHQPKILSDDPWQAVMQVPDPSRDLVDELRQRHQIQSFFPDAEYSSSDKRWMVALCPFHQDKHPSFWIDTQRQICGCHSGCTSKALDVINLYARLHGLSNRDAIFWMAKL